MCVPPAERLSEGEQMLFTKEVLFENPNLVSPKVILQEAEVILNAKLPLYIGVGTVDYMLDLKGIKLHPTVKEKLQAYRTLFTPSTTQEWQVFELVANTIIDGEYLETQRPPSFIEAILCLDLLADAIPHKKVEAMLSDEVKRYLGTVWKFRGGLVFPKDYAFLDKYIFATVTKAEVTPEQERARRVADKFVTAKYPVSAFRETVDGVLAGRIHLIEEGRKMFKDQGYISKDLFFNIP